MNHKTLAALLLTVVAYAPTWVAAPSALASEPKLPGPSQPSVQAVAPKPEHGYWQIEATPGEIVRLEALVRNAGSARATFALGATGAGTGSTTGVGYTLGTGPTSSWLTGLPASVTLGPGESALVHATLTVPPSAKVAYQYVGGIEALGAAATHSGRSKVEIAQRDAAVVAWVVTVGSPKTKKIVFGKPGVRGAAAPEVVFPASNVGQVLWAPQVSLAVRAGPCRKTVRAGHGAGRGTSRASHDLLSVTRQWSTTVPGTSWGYPVYLQAALAPGAYCAVEQTVPGQPQYRTFVVTSEQHRSETASPGEAHVRTVGTSNGAPWLLLALAAALAILLILVLVVLLWRSTKHAKGP